MEGMEAKIEPAGEPGTRVDAMLPSEWLDRLTKQLGFLDVTHTMPRGRYRTSGLTADMLKANSDREEPPYAPER